MEIIAQIKKDIAQKRSLECELQQLKRLYTDRFATDAQKSFIAQEIKRLQEELGLQDEFQYLANEITVARPTEMLVPMMIPRSGIIPVIGHYGAGKTTLARHLYKLLLSSRNDTYVKYVDVDNPINKLQEFCIHELIETYGDRFEYYGKRLRMDDLADGLENVIRKAIEQQTTFPQRSYIIFEDNLKNLMRKKSAGFCGSKPFISFGKRVSSGRWNIDYSSSYK